MELEEKRDQRVRDAALAYGIEIVEPVVAEGSEWAGAKFNVPNLHEWIPIIEDIESLMQVDILNDIDLDNEREVKILFLKYIVLANPSDLSIAIKKSIGLWDAAQVALDNFRDTKIRQQRSPDTD